MRRVLHALLCSMFAAGTALAEGEAPPSEKKISFGVGLRAGGGYTNTPASGTTPATDTLGLMGLDVRPYISGQVFPFLKFEGNLDLAQSDQGRIHVLDAVAKLEPNELFNVWFGRFLPPSDRANLSGPYYQNAWNYPDAVNGYPSIYAGRADGLAVWGQWQGRFKYQAGYFTLDPATPAKNGIYAGRLTYDFLDPEPGYYNSSTYFGTKDVLALGAAIQYQRNGGGSEAAKEDLLGFNVDLLFEKRLAPGTASIEGAYYNFNQGSQGQSFFVLGSWLFADKIGPGRFQPMARYQQLIPSGGGDSLKVIDGGVNYILDGHNARVAFVVQHRDVPVGPSLTSVQLGIQIQQ